MKAVSQTFTDRLKWLDRSVYLVEQIIVSVAAIMMTTTVTLDIVFRALKGQRTEPFNSTLNLFGLFAKGSGEDLPFAILPMLALLLVPFGLGWAVYASLHRGESKHKLALKSGLHWMLGAIIASIVIYQTPSSYVCACLAIIFGLVAFKSVSGSSSKQVLISMITLLIAWGSFSLPQDYIWSQELSLILLAWVAFLGASMATFQNKHIQISALAGVIPVPLKPYIRPLGLVVTAIFTTYLTMSLWGSVFGEKGSWSSGEVRPATGLPAWIILFSGICAFTLISIRSLCYGVAGFLDPKQPSEEVAH